jgi:excisionase family DNA binding protein
MGIARTTFLTPDQIAWQLRVTRPTVNRWLRSGKLKGARVAGKWRISHQAFEGYCKQHGLGESHDEKPGDIVREGSLNYRLAPDGSLLWFEVSDLPRRNSK